MSVEAVSWALNDAPDVPASCLAVLIGLANHAHPDGRGAYPSQERLAHYARKSTRAVRNDLAELERRGLIRRGNQAHVVHIPPDRRPIVWDLAMERRRPVPPTLDPRTDPQSGRPHATPEPVDNRPEADFRPAPTGRKQASAPAGSVLPPRPEAGFRLTVRRTIKEPSAARPNTGAALPPPQSRAPERCPRHRGQYRQFCGPCRSEALGVNR